MCRELACDPRRDVLLLDDDEYLASQRFQDERIRPRIEQDWLDDQDGRGQLRDWIEFCQRFLPPEQVLSQWRRLHEAAKGMYRQQDDGRHQRQQQRISQAIQRFQKLQAEAASLNQPFHQHQQEGQLELRTSRLGMKKQQLRPASGPAKLETMSGNTEEIEMTGNSSVHSRNSSMHLGAAVDPCKKTGEEEEGRDRNEKRSARRWGQGRKGGTKVSPTIPHRDFLPNSFASDLVSKPNLLETF